MTDSTPTTPLDLDAAIARARVAMLDQGSVGWMDSVDDVPTLVEEVKRLRGLHAQACEIGMRMVSERDAAIARAEVAEAKVADWKQDFDLIARKLADMQTERDEALAKVADYEKGIVWHTTCTNCANLTGQLYDVEVRLAEVGERIAVAMLADEAGLTLVERLRHEDNQQFIGGSSHGLGPDEAADIAQEWAARIARATTTTEVGA